MRKYLTQWQGHPTLKNASRSDLEIWVSRNTLCQRSGRIIPPGSSELFQLISSFNDFQLLFIVDTSWNYLHLERTVILNIDVFKTHFDTESSPLPHRRRTQDELRDATNSTVIYIQKFPIMAKLLESTFTLRSLPNAHRLPNPRELPHVQPQRISTWFLMKFRTDTLFQYTRHGIYWYAGQSFSKILRVKPSYSLITIIVLVTRLAVVLIQQLNKEIAQQPLTSIISGI